MTYSIPLPRSSEQRRALVGATPELLLCKRGSRILSMPLAGSVRRQADPAADCEAAESILSSEKNRREHASVVDWVADCLRPYCSTLDVPETPSLISTATMWHLATRIEGELRDPALSSLKLVNALHPTPAVCGLPQGKAQNLISELEPFDRGFFGGVVGWCDAAGDGQWFLAIAARSCPLMLHAFMRAQESLPVPILKAKPKRPRESSRPC